MNPDKKELGRTGEDIAEKYLIKHGYEILKRNLKTKRAEIDIIAKKNGILVFIEVRSKTNNNFGTPEETINKKKRWKLEQNARGYVSFKKYQGIYRIDAICIIFDKDRKVEKLNHYENIIF